MRDAGIDETVIDTLRAAVETNQVPETARESAEHLIRRLESPVRISVLGLPKSGKSELINMLLGRRLFPKDASLPTTEIIYGDAEKMKVTLADGSVKTSDVVDLKSIDRKGAAFLVLELPIAILQRISILEVVTDGTMAELSSAVDWAVRRTDIALWATQTFGEDEQAVWQRVPDGLKDHAFMVLTKADVLSAERSLSTRVASLEKIVAEEFHSLFAVATLQAINAHRGDNLVDEAMYHASGGGALSSEILRHAERGRRADFDGAFLFLSRYKIVHSSPTAKVVTRPAPVTEPVAVPEPVAELVPKSERPKNVALFTDAVRFLKRRGDSLAELVETVEEGATKPVLDQCVDAIEHLTDLFSQDESGCPAADAFLDELADAEDLMVLMQIEDGDAPAADGATLLLQLRRDMEMKLAA